MRKVLFLESGDVCDTAFRKKFGSNFDLYCSSTPEDFYEMLDSEEGIQLAIVEDKPGEIDGFAVLEQAKALLPSAIRILICGKLAADTAVKAVNSCQVFRIIPKPCSSALMKLALQESFVEYDRIHSGAIEAEKTRKSIVKVLRNYSSWLCPEREARTIRILPVIKMLCRKMSDTECEVTEIVATLSICGFVFLPENIRRKLEDGEVLSGNEYELYKRHAHFSAKLVSEIYKFDNIASILGAQEMDYQEQRDDGRKVCLGARIIRVVSDYDRLSIGGRPAGEVVAMMRRREKRYDPSVLDCLVSVLGEDARSFVKEVYPLGLEAGMVLGEDVFGNINGAPVKFMSKDQVLTSENIDYLYRNAEKILDVTKRIKIKVSTG